MKKKKKAKGIAFFETKRESGFREEGRGMMDLEGVRGEERRESCAFFIDFCKNVKQGPYKHI